MKAQNTSFPNGLRSYLAGLLSIVISIASHATIEITNVGCINGTGSIELTAEPDEGFQTAGPFTFQWTGPGGYISSAQNPDDIIAGGMYFVTVTNAYGCSTELSTEIALCGLPFNIFPENIPCLCSPDNPITIDINVIGGAAPISFNWIGSFGYTSQQEDPGNITAAGSYILVATDANGLTVDLTVVVETCAEISIDVNSVTCVCSVENPASIDIEVTPFNIEVPLPNNIYTYLWSGPMGYSSDVEDPSDITNPGTYTVVATNPSGCSSQLDVDVNTCLSYTFAVSQPQSSVDPFGEVIVNMTPVNQAYEVEVVNDSGTTVYSNIEDGKIKIPLNSGVYCITVEANGCAITECFNICGYPKIFPEVNHACSGGADGSISLNPSAHYSYLWSNGAEDVKISGLSPGTYTVTITPTAGCDFVEEFTIGSSDIVVADPAIVHPPDCTSNKGSIDFTGVEPSGGTAPYTFAWDNGGTGELLPNLTIGSYTVTITDANGCTTTDTYHLFDEDLSLVLEIIDVTAAVGEECNGSITVQVTFEAPNAWIRLWRDGEIVQSSISLTQNGSNVHLYTFENLCGSKEPDDYTVESWTSGNGMTCELFEETTVPACPKISINGPPPHIRLPTSCAANDGSIFFNGASTACILSNGIGEWVFENGFVSGLPPGKYVLTCTDANGCTSEREFDLTIEESIKFFGITDVQNAIASEGGNGCNGSITASVLMGIDGYPITLVLEGEGILIEETFASGDGFLEHTFEGLCAGDYTVTATQASGCMAADEGTILGCPEIGVPSPEFTNASFCGKNDGTISFLHGGGPSGGQSPYTNIELRDENGNLVPGGNGSWIKLAVGTYTMYITDYYGCVGTHEYTISSPDTPEIEDFTFFNPECQDLKNGSIEAFAFSGGGEVKYSYEFTSDQLPQNITIVPDQFDPAKLDGLSTGMYCITATGLESGCTAEFCGTVEEIPSRGEFRLVDPADPGTPAEFFTTEKSCPEQATGSITFWLMGGTPPYFIELDNGSFAESSDNPAAPTEMTINDLWARKYSTVLIRDLAYCDRRVDNVTGIDVGKYPEMVITSVPRKDCPGLGEIDLTVTAGAGGPYTFLWDTGATTEDLTALSDERDYSVTVTDGSGCFKVHSVFLDLYERASVSAGVNIAVSCPDYMGALTGVIGEIEIYSITGDIKDNTPSISWSGNSISSDEMTISELEPGTYSVTIEDGCFPTIRSFIIDEGQVVERPSDIGTCYNYIMCESSGSSEQIDITWGGYSITQVVPNDDGDCEVFIHCVNDNMDGPFTSPGSVVDYNGNCDECIETKACDVHVFTNHLDGFVDAFDVSHDPDFLIDEFQSGQIDVEIPLRTVPAVNLGTSGCASNKLSVQSFCGDEPAPVCTECVDCEIVSATATDNFGTVCFAVVECMDGEGNTHEVTVEGTAFTDSFEPSTSPNSSYNCPELCHDGFHCINSQYCIVDGFNAFKIKDFLFVEFSALTDDNDDIIPCAMDSNGDIIQASCTVRYKCVGGGNFHSWCDNDCSPLSPNPNIDDFQCFADPISTCSVPNFAPPVVVSREINDKGEVVYTYTADILEGKRFKVTGVFPNPFQKELNVSINSNYTGKVNIKLFNSLGRIVKDIDPIIKEGKSTINLALEQQVPNGIYFLTIKGENGNSYSATVINNPD